jgi:Ca-activated chloride channel family protein
MFPVAKDANGKLVFRMMPVEIDQKLMQEIAKSTDAKYFRATSNQKLQAIYDEINKLETTEIDEKKFYNYDEKYKSFALIAFVLLGIEVLLRNSVFRGIV